jgi:hypothetical protein
VSVPHSKRVKTQTDNSSLSKSLRNQHVQICLRQDIASKQGRLQSEVHYCHYCFEWVLSEEGWEEHCQRHLEALTSKRCGTITYSYTLIRPGYCPFCLGNEASLAAQRLESWSRDHKLWQHVNDHARERSWPIACPHPLCDVSLGDDTSLQFHLIDNHGFSRTRPGQADRSALQQSSLQDSPDEPSDRNARAGRKRRSENEGGTLCWMPPASFSATSLQKRARTIAPTISPSLISSLDEKPEIRSPCFGSTDAFPSFAEEWNSLDLDGIHSGLGPTGEPYESDTELEASPSGDIVSTDQSSSDDGLFSQFIRSSSPSCLSAATIGDDDGGATSAECSTITSTLPLTGRTTNRAGNGQNSQSGPRIRLRVQPPKPKITLRFTRPKANAYGKRNDKRGKRRVKRS